MSKGSAFARVIGLTKSFTPLAFDRSAAAIDDGDEAPAPAGAAEAATNESAVIVPAVSAVAEIAPVPKTDTSAVAAAAATASAPAEVVVAFPAMSQVTVVTGDVPAAPAADAADEPKPLPEGGVDAISSETISAIEADIASLLASLDHEEGLPGTADDGPVWLADSEADDDEEFGQASSMGDLLLELDRMWQADPEIPSQRLH